MDNFLIIQDIVAVSYTHLRAHETVLDLVCRLLLEKKKRKHTNNIPHFIHHKHKKNKYYYFTT